MPSAIGPYRVARRLGAGGTAVTFKVLVPNTDQKRYGCLKMLHAGLMYDDKAMRRFRKEANVAALLSHRNLTALLDYDFDNEPPYLVYQYVDGLTLSELAAWQRLTIEDVLYVGSEVATGLHYAHNFGAEGKGPVMHRDLSPRNIMLSLAGDVMLTDFGLAKVTGQMTATITTDVSGTPAYLPPEALEGKAVDHRGDLYALGIILYELASGRRPVVRDNVMALLYGMSKGDYPDIAELAPDYPDRFHEITRALMKREPDERPTAREVLEALSECGATRARRGPMGDLVSTAIQHGASTNPPPSDEREIVAPRSVSKKLWPIAIVVALLGVIGVAGAVLFQSQEDATTQTTPLTVSSSQAEAPAPPAPQEVVPTTALPPEPEVTQVVAEEPPSIDPKPAVSETKPAATKPRKRKRAKAQPKPKPAPKVIPNGSLAVKVAPWGDVIVDGRKVGRAPVKVQLKPGRYQVRAVAGALSKTTTVTIESEKTLSLTMRLTPEDR